LIKAVVGGKLTPEGNGWDTVAAKFIPTSEIESYSEKEMKQIYKDILKKALDHFS
jgi:hypothetical protein